MFHFPRVQMEIVTERRLPLEGLHHQLPIGFACLAALGSTEVSVGSCQTGEDEQTPR